MVKCVLEDGVKLGWDWKERWAKVVIVVGGWKHRKPGVVGYCW